MKVLTLGFWDLADQCLQCIGKRIAWLLLRRRYKSDEGALCAATGGALVCAVFGAVVGFTVSDPLRNLGAISGTIFGCLLGMCIGIYFGVFVEIVDDAIQDLLKSVRSN